MNCSNGRVDILNIPEKQILPTSFAAAFALMDKNPVHDKTTNYRDALNGNKEMTPLSTAFFSGENIDIIQNSIRREIYEKTGKVIDRQATTEIKIVMRSTFLQWSNNCSKNISEQIAEMNSIVVEYCVRAIYTELQGYYKYREDASTIAVPHDLPVLSNTKNKTLEQKPWF